LIFGMGNNIEAVYTLENAEFCVCKFEMTDFQYFGCADYAALE